jgi:nitrogen fixation-related uncharacterized protein
MKIIMEIIIIGLLTALMALLIVEWAIGCGQPYTDAQGVEHIGQCWVLKLKEQ